MWSIADLIHVIHAQPRSADLDLPLISFWSRTEARTVSESKTTGNLGNKERSLPSSRGHKQAFDSFGIGLARFLLLSRSIESYALGRMADNSKKNARLQVLVCARRVKSNHLVRTRCEQCLSRTSRLFPRGVVPFSRLYPQSQQRVERRRKGDNTGDRGLFEGQDVFPFMLRFSNPFPEFWNPLEEADKASRLQSPSRD